MLNEIFSKIDAAQDLDRDDLKYMLSLEKEDEVQALFDKAYQMKVETVGNKVYFRGIIEFSNICTKDCYYCGIRKSNGKTERFQLTEDEIVEGAVWAWKNDYGSLVLQSGERADDHFIDFIEKTLLRIKKETNGELGITLSLGEQTVETYRRWFEAGSHRYLLRIETTSPKLYAKLHPADDLHNFEARVACLGLLRKVGFQVGTGVMIGLPDQTIDDLVSDILFFKKKDIDMIGMGPYIVHHETPMAEELPDFGETEKLANFNMGLKMISTVRLFLKDVNIAATTALQAIDKRGREKGVQAGANIIMPNVTETKYRPNYQLYDSKPCLDENSSMCRGCLSRRIESVGETIGFGEWGDSPHFHKRTETETETD